MKIKHPLVGVFFLLSVVMISCAPENRGYFPGSDEDPMISTDEINQTETDLQVQLPSPTVRPPQLEAINSTWNQYTNFRLGIAIQVPRLMYRHDAACTWNEGDGDSSFRPQGGLMPVVVVEEEDRLIITSRYLIRLVEPTSIPSGAGYVTRFGGCERHQADPEVLASDETDRKSVV